MTRTPLLQANAYAKIQRWAQAAGIKTRIGNNTFRATGMTTYLKKAWRERMYDACDTADDAHSERRLAHFCEKSSPKRDV